MKYRDAFAFFSVLFVRWPSYLAALALVLSSFLLAACADGLTGISETEHLVMAEGGTVRAEGGTVRAEGGTVLVKKGVVLTGDEAMRSLIARMEKVVNGPSKAPFLRLTANGSKMSLEKSLRFLKRSRQLEQSMEDETSKSIIHAKGRWAFSSTSERPRRHKHFTGFYVRQGEQGASAGSGIPHRNIKVGLSISVYDRNGDPLASFFAPDSDRSAASVETHVTCYSPADEMAGTGTFTFSHFLRPPYNEISFGHAYCI